MHLCRPLRGSGTARQYPSTTRPWGLPASHAGGMACEAKLLTARLRSSAGAGAALGIPRSAAESDGDVQQQDTTTLGGRHTPRPSIPLPAGIYWEYCRLPTWIHQLLPFDLLQARTPRQAVSAEGGPARGGSLSMPVNKP
ncbi:unnamed protein product [Arctogadus glacialis]